MQFNRNAAWIGLTCSPSVLFFQYEISRGGKQFHKFMVAQIQLLMVMCKGNNTRVIDVLKQQPNTKSIGVQMDFSLIMSAVKDSKIKTSHPKLRAALVDLLKGESPVQ
jgi:hypothetical protein